MTKRQIREPEMQQQIPDGPSALEDTEDRLSKTVPFFEAVPVSADKMSNNAGECLKAKRPKVPVSLRLDPDVVARFKAHGPGWQTRMNEALRRAVGLP